MIHVDFQISYLLDKRCIFDQSLEYSTKRGNVDYCSCSNTALINNGAIYKNSTYTCEVCKKVIPIARIWGFKVKSTDGPDESRVRLLPKEGSNDSSRKSTSSVGVSSSSSSWQQSARFAEKAALSVSNYVRVINFIAYVLIGILTLGVLRAAIDNLAFILALLPLLLLAALQFIWGQSIYMVTEYIRFKTKKAISEE